MYPENKYAEQAVRETEIMREVSRVNDDARTVRELADSLIARLGVVMQNTPEKLASGAETPVIGTNTKLGAEIRNASSILTETSRKLEDTLKRLEI